MSQITAPQPQILEELSQRRAKNMAFFKKTYPKIHSAFADYRFSKIKLNIDTEKNDIDILLNGKSLYPQGALSHALEENQQFKSVYSKGKPLVTLRPTFSSDFPLQRQFHKNMHDLLESSPLKSSDSSHGRYILENFYPLIIFCGIGSGIHIREFIKNNEVQNIVIAETDIDYFAASLYTVDWEEIYETHQASDGKSFDILLGAIEQPEHIFEMIWNKMIQFCPIFPLASVFYNHKANPKYAAPIDKACQEIRLFLQIFGFYDDEINQLNNALHNLSRGIGKIPSPIKAIEKPVCLIGGGPSIDDRIQDLITYRDKLTIVSCGTGIRTLYKNNIKPDIHVELESHLITLEHLHNAAPSEWLKDIHFVGAAQVSPLVFELFESKRVYFKQESAMAHLFGSEKENIDQGTPTCTNAATALAAQNQCKHIFFFGMDFGFKDQKQHHSKDSIFYSKNAPDLWKESSKRQAEESTFSQPGVNKTEIQTSNILFYARRKIETIVALSPENQYFNCSDGAAIEGSHWLTREQFARAMTAFSGNEIGLREHLFSENKDTYISKSTIKSKLYRIEEAITYIEKEASTVFSKVTNDSLYEFSKTILKLNRIIDSEIPNKFPEAYFFIRGSIWHLLFAAYSHAFDIQDKSSRKQWIDNFREQFPLILAELKQHYVEITSKEQRFDDPWIHCSLNDPEPER